MDEDSKSKERSFKEQRIREICFIYYSIPEVRKAMFEFSQNRETIPRYYEGFGKRPDCFQYDSDISEQVRKGATSFHCSEEIWEDPLEISNDLSQEEFNDLRTGWDLLLDIDSPYLEYSKIYADLLIQTLEFHGVKNIGIKFSGSKGFHLIIPWKAFPKEIYGNKTKNMFPEWPRAICEYLTSVIQPKLADAIFEQHSLKDLAEKTGKKQEDLLITECLTCHRPSETRVIKTWSCPYCKTETEMQNKNKKIPKCPNCRTDLIEKSKQEFYFCDYCNINSKNKPKNFTKTREKTETLIEADLVLVAPRHLFRLPYSLHEKTALASIVLDKDKIKDFQILDAKPLNVEIKNFYPSPKQDEAKQLLLQALDWKEQKKEKIPYKPKSNQNSQFNEFGELDPSSKKEYKNVTIHNPTADIYPPCITWLLKGLKQDGRKRGLFILINFFKTLGVSEEKLSEIIHEWNEKNYKPLKNGYIQSQLNWYQKTGSRLPPNCDKPNYKDLAICKPDELCRQIKNPINYAFKKYFQNKKG